MKRPLVSVVLCTFNRPSGLRHALGSILGQGFESMEVVVANGGGADISDVVGAFLRQLPIRLITQSTNRGLAFSRKTGLAAARGTYIAFLDDDDLWLPDHRQTAVAGIAATGADLVYTHMAFSWAANTRATLAVYGNLLGK